MNNNIDTITRENPEDITFDRKLKDDEFKAQQERNKNKKTLFYSVLLGSAIIMVIAVCCSVYAITSDVKPNTQEVAIIAMLITSPIILSLALMRYIYDGKKTDAPQPTLLLNIGKELADVLKKIFEK